MAVERTTEKGWEVFFGDLWAFAGQGIRGQGMFVSLPSQIE
jgi:hypothetical protein